ncbi:hypothetical protein MPH_08869 [Macrophomina phaseolina MS6]|uniref:Uncharacterized protein n=2 Tax=Macrophomina phaseolina TaxID=35725 RepID=K2SAU4_MACPH|nr:hypothetical protein MPH_08869 [Macrophomina phaseolina MS6]KAH7052231.1 WD40-repeat-containing domain protein [Macrophomina phaseolina]
MPVPQPAVLVARFLRANNYSNTLAAFLQEANLPSDTGTVSTGDLTIEQVLREKETFDLSVNFEKLGVDDADKGWRMPAPSMPTELATLPAASNILNTSVELLTLSDNQVEPSILCTTADRRLHIVSACDNTLKLQRSLPHVQDSPILSYSVLKNRYILMSSMSGKIVLYDCLSDTVISERRDHSKYAVKITTREQPDGTWVVTAGWDAKVFVYFITNALEHQPQLQAPVAALTLSTNPEAIMFLEHPETARPLLLLTRRDSTFLHYYALPTLGTNVNAPVPLQMLGKQNLAPASNAWVAFTPSSISLCPTDASLLAVATSAVPHMKLIMVRLLVPPANEAEAGSEGSIGASVSEPANDGGLITLTQATQARAALATQERELAAILVQCSTMASQTAYSTPALAWRPDGSGVWVNSDDGVVRGVEASTGKVIASLKGHEPASKVRCVWAGSVGRLGETGEEWMLSGGFDQRLIIWRVPPAEAGPS